MFKYLLLNVKYEGEENMSKKPVFYRTLVVGIIVCFIILSPSYLAITKDRINHQPEAPEIKGSHSRDYQSPIQSPIGFSPKGYWNITTTDPDGDDIYLLIDWGDGTTSDWFGLYHSDEKVSVNHTYCEKGTYLIRARAKDTHGAIGPWGEEMIPIQNPPFEVKITQPQNGIYCKDKKILPFFVPLILYGGISIKAEVTPEYSSYRMELYINDWLQEFVEGSGPDYVFALTWSAFSKVNIKVIAYSLNETASDEITVWRIFQ